MKAMKGSSSDVDDAFLIRLGRAFAAARGNDAFPATRPLSKLVQAWVKARALSAATAGAVVDVHSGMIPWISWAGLLAERDLGGMLAPSTELGALPASVNDARSRLLQREAAARALAAAPTLRLLHIDVVVRRVEGQRALLTMVLDRTDASGLFVRISVDAWVAVSARSSVVLDDDRGQASAGLKDLLSLASHLPAPALLVRASTLAGIEVERLSRGVVGPCSHARGGPAWGDDDDDAFALVLSLEELSPQIAVTSDNDVFAHDDLNALMQALPRSLQHFRAFRDAKAVVSPSSLQLLKTRSQQRGLRTVLHPL